MDLHRLRLFKHLASSLHFGRTSRACHVSASALSRIIQRLEEEIGESLFLRDNRSVQLTPAGEAFRGYTEDVIDRFEVLQKELSQEQRLTGEISLYCSVTAAYSILPDIFQRFRSTYPDVQLNLQTGDAALAIDKLVSREADLTVAALPAKLPERLFFLEVRRTPLDFIAPVDFPEAVVFRNGEIDWQQTLLILADYGLSRERTEKWFQEKGITPNIYAQVAGNEAIIAMVSLGCGVGVVPRLVLEKSPLHKKVQVLDVDAALEPFAVGICASKKSLQRPQVAAFWKVAGELRTE